MILCGQESETCSGNFAKIAAWSVDLCPDSGAERVSLSHVLRTASGKEPTTANCSEALRRFRAASHQFQESASMATF